MKSQKVRAYVEICGSCNLSCSFCPSSAEQNHRGAMGLDFFAEILPEIVESADEIALHVLGEPLLHHEFTKILDLIDTSGLGLQLSTNGTLLGKHRSRLLTSSALGQINISLHSLAEIPRQETRLSYIAGVLEFCNFFSTQRPGVYINLRLWNLGGGADSGSSVDFMAELAPIFRAVLGVDLPPPGGHLVRRGIRLRARLYVQYDTRFDWPGVASPALVQPITKGRCYGLLNQFGILADGRVVPCCLDQGGAITLGTLAIKGSTRPRLAEILASPRARAMGEGFTQGLLVEEFCQNCTFCRRFT